MFSIIVIEKTLTNALQQLDYVKISKQYLTERSISSLERIRFIRSSYAHLQAGLLSIISYPFLKTKTNKSLLHSDTNQSRHIWTKRLQLHVLYFISKKWIWSSRVQFPPRALSMHIKLGTVALMQSARRHRFKFIISFCPHNVWHNCGDEGWVLGLQEIQKLDGCLVV